MKKPAESTAGTTATVRFGFSTLGGFAAAPPLLEQPECHSLDQQRGTPHTPGSHAPNPSSRVRGQRAGGTGPGTSGVAGTEPVVSLTHSHGQHKAATATHSRVRLKSDLSGVECVSRLLAWSSIIVEQPVIPVTLCNSWGYIVRSASYEACVKRSVT